MPQHNDEQDNGIDPETRKYYEANPQEVHVDPQRIHALVKQYIGDAATTPEQYQELFTQAAHDAAEDYVRAHPRSSTPQPTVAKSTPPSAPSSFAGIPLPPTSLKTASESETTPVPSSLSRTNSKANYSNVFHQPEWLPKVDPNDFSNGTTPSQKFFQSVSYQNKDAVSPDAAGMQGYIAGKAADWNNGDNAVAAARAHNIQVQEDAVLNPSDTSQHEVALPQTQQQLRNQAATNQFNTNNQHTLDTIAQRAATANAQLEQQAKAELPNGTPEEIAGKKVELYRQQTLQAGEQRSALQGEAVKKWDAIQQQFTGSDPNRIKDLVSANSLNEKMELANDDGKFGRDGFDRSQFFNYNDDGTVKDIKPTFFQQIYTATNGDPSKFYAAADDLVQGAIDNHNGKPSTLGKATQASLDFLHDNAVTDFVSHIPYIGNGLQAIARTPYYAGRFAQGTAQGATGVAAMLHAGLVNPLEQLITGDQNSFADAYGRDLKLRDQWVPDVHAQNLGADGGVAGFVDKTADMGLHMTGEFAGVPAPAFAEGGLLGKLADATAGLDAPAYTAMGSKLGFLNRALDGLNGTRLGNYLDGVSHMTITAGPQMLADATAENMKRGMKPDEALKRATSDVGLDLLLFPAAGLASPTKSMAGVTKDILAGAETEGAPLLETDRSFAKQYLKTVGNKYKSLAGQAALGGAGFGAGSLAHSYKNYIDGIHDGSIAPGTPFDAKQAFKDAIDQFVSGAVFSGAHAIMQGHGSMPNDPQAAAIAKASEDLPRFASTLDKQVQQGKYTQEQADNVKGLISRVQPEIEARKKQGYSPLQATQGAIETERLKETAQAITDLSTPDGLPKGVLKDKEGKLVAQDEDGVYTTKAASPLVKQLNDLTDKAAASQHALTKLEEGTSLQGRTVGGKEMAALSQKYTPAASLSSKQANEIIKNGPYRTETTNIEHFAEDPAIAKLIEAHKEGTSKFEPKNTPPVVLGQDGGIIDGKERVAYNLFHGMKTIETARPVSLHEIGEQVQAAHEENGSPTVAAPTIPNATPKVQEAITTATDMFNEHANDARPATQDEADANLNTPAMRATHAAAATLLEQGIKPEQAKELLPEVTGGAVTPVQAETIVNDIQQEGAVAIGDETHSARKHIQAFDKAFEVADRKWVDEPAPVNTEQSTEEPTLQPAEHEILNQHYDTTEQLNADYDRRVEEGRIDPAAEAGSNTGTQGPLATTEAENPTASTDSNAGSSGTVEGDSRADDEPATGGTTPIKKGNAIILASKDSLKAAGWSRQHIQAMGKHLADMFGADTGVVVVDADSIAQYKRETGVPASLRPDAWFDEKTGNIVIDVSHAHPSKFIHENGHLWMDWTKKNAPELHNRGLDLARQSEQYQYAVSLLQPEGEGATQKFSLSTDEKARWKQYAKAYSGRADAAEALAEEVLAHSIENIGRNLVGENKKGFTAWLKELFTQLKKAAGFSNLGAKEFADLTLDQFARKATEEITSGRALTKKIRAIAAEESVAQKERRIERVQDKRANEVDESLAITAERGPASGRNEEDAGEQTGVHKGEADRAAFAARIASRVRASDVLPFIETHNPDLYSDLLKKVGQTDAYKASGAEGFDQQKAESLLLDMMDDVRSISTADRAIVGGIEKRRGVTHLTGPIGDAFEAIGNLMKGKSEDIEVRPKDLAIAFADRAAEEHRQEQATAERSARAKAQHSEAKFSLSEEDKTPTDKALEDLKAMGLTKQQFKDAGIIIQDSRFSLEQLNDAIQRAYDHVSAMSDTPLDAKRFADNMRMIANDVAKEAPITESGKFTTSLKGAVEDKEREAQGLTPLPAAITRPWDVVKGEADEIRADATAGEAAVANLLDKHENGRHALTDKDVAVLLQGKITLENDRQRINREINEAYAAGDKEEVQRLEVTREQLAEKRERFARIVKIAKSETGRGLNALRMLAKDDYTLDYMLEEKRASNGGKSLTKAQIAEVEALHKKIEQLQTESDAHEANAKKLTAENERLKTAKNEVERVVRVTKTERSESGAKTKASKAYESKVEAFYRKLGKPLPEHLRRNTAPDAEGTALYSLPEETEAKPNKLSNDEKALVKDLYRDLIVSGERDVAEMTKRVHADLKEAFDWEVTQPQIRDAFSGYGETKHLSQEETEVALRAAREEARYISKREDVESGNPPKKSGMQRGDMTDEERLHTAEINRLMKEHNIKSEDNGKSLRTARDRVKRALINQIADLKRQAETKVRDLKKNGIEYDDELNELVAKRDELRRILDELVPKPGLSEEEQAAHYVQVLERAIKIMESKLDGTYEEPQQTDKPTNFKIEQLTTELDGLKAERVAQLKAQRDANKIFRSPEQKATDAAIKSKEREIATLEEDKKNGKLEPDAKVSLVDKSSQRYKDAAARLNELRAERKQLQDETGITYQKKLQLLKNDLDKQEAYYKDKLQRGDFTTTQRAVATPLDNEGIAKKAAVQQAKNAFNHGLEAARYARRGKTERWIDRGKSWGKGSKLFGVLIYPKLLATDIKNTATNVVEAGTGHVIAKLLGAVGRKAYGEGAVHISAEAKNWVTGLVEGLKEVPHILKGGHSAVQEAYGKPKKYAPNDLTKYVAASHEALKAPLFRARFEAYANKMTQNMLDAGIDVDDPMVKAKIINQSMEAGQRITYANNNPMANRIRQFVKSFERADKKGRVSNGRKFFGALVDAEVPFTTVASNIAYGIADRYTGVPRGIAKLRTEYKNTKNEHPELTKFKERWRQMADDLDSEQVDYIVRLMKKGLVGLAFNILAAHFALNFGGKRVDGRKEKEGLKEDEVDIAGYHLPHWVNEDDLMQSMQWTSTAVNYYKQLAEEGKMSDKGAMFNAGLKTVMGFGTNLPFFSEGERLGRIYHSHGNAGDKALQFVNDLTLGDLVPQASKDIAKMSDKDEEGNPITRVPTAPSEGGYGQNLWQSFETRVPGLRENVPEKEQTNHRPYGRRTYRRRIK